MQQEKAMIIQETNRTIVERIEHSGKKAVRKTFKNMEQERFERIMRIMFNNSISPEIIDTDPATCSYVMPYYPYTLNQYLQEKGDEVDKCKLVTRLALGLFDLWQHGYIHRDVHANNVFITNAGVLLLGDWEHVHPRKIGNSFIYSPDLVGGHGIRAYWDKGCKADIGTVLGIDKEFAVDCVRESLVESLEESGGAYWERTSKGQIYGDINVPGFNVAGRRDPKARLDQFGIDFTDKTVLDIGCNAGAISFEAFNRGASKVTGIELLMPRVSAARSIANFAGIDDKVWFHQRNFDKTAIGVKYDIVCAFAVDHQTQQPESFYRKLFNATGDTLLFESSKQPEFRGWCMQQLGEAGFGYVKYIGESSASDKKHRSRMCYIAKRK
jgi:2-polyprenyl-3-methyl-5-hydroxy-6-metoxy-1,4-benzoquinol methylase